MIDRFNRKIKVERVKKQKVYSIPGMSLTFPEDWPENKVLDTFNAHAPKGYKVPDVTPSNEEIMAQIQELLKKIKE